MASSSDPRPPASAGPDEARLRVHKYGGPCMAGPAERARLIAELAGHVAAGVRVAAVVSAPGRPPQPYATDSLLALLGEARRDCPARELDLLLASGELIAVALLVAELRRAGIHAAGLSGAEAGIRTDAGHGEARITGVEADRLAALLECHPVVVVAGFQGSAPDGSLATLGRGGSDLTAVALAAALGVGQVWIYKDVEGVCSADPRRVPGARPIRAMNAEDVRQMAWQGARVLHPRAAELAGELAVEVIVQSTAGEGRTRIRPGREVCEGRHVTAVAAAGPVCQLRIDLPPARGSTAAAAEIFAAVAAGGISADMIAVGEHDIRFTVPDADGPRAAAILAGLALAAAVRPGCARVSIVGAAMHGVPGIMARFCRALEAAAVPILQTVDSHATISALVPLAQAGAAEQALHREFIETGPDLRNP